MAVTTVLSESKSQSKESKKHGFLNPAVLQFSISLFVHREEANLAISHVCRRLGSLIAFDICFSTTYFPVVQISSDGYGYTVILLIG